MKRNIPDLLIPLIEKSLRDLQLDKLAKAELYLDLPKDMRFGDLTTNIALRLSKLSQKTPLETAQNIVVVLQKYLEKAPLKDLVKEVKVESAPVIEVEIPIVSEVAVEPVVEVQQAQVKLDYSIVDKGGKKYKLFHRVDGTTDLELL